MYKLFNSQILSSVSKSELQEDPYPYFFADKVFDDNLYDKIRDKFPENNNFANQETLQKNNFSIKINVSEVLQSDNFDQDWKEIFSFLSSREFFDVVTDKYHNSIRNYYPNLNLSPYPYI